MRILKKYLLGLIVAFVLSISLFSIWVSDKYVVPVMMYHHVADSDRSQVNFVSPEKFERQMTYLKKHHYNVISLDQYFELKLKQIRMPRKSVVITFDDGYEDNFLNALEIIKRNEFPAAVFISPGNVNTEQFMNWDQIRIMNDYGVRIGSHAVSHEYLPEMDLGDQEKEIFNSKKIIEQRIGRSVDYFAYPIGGFDQNTKRLVKLAGYKGALTTNRGYDRYNNDIYEINRIRFNNKDDNDFYLWAKLSGYYNLFRKGRNPY